MQELDNLQKQNADKKDKDMKEAVNSTEEIRTWTDHMWECDKLCNQFKTHPEKGMV